MKERGEALVGDAAHGQAAAGVGPRAAHVARMGLTVGAGGASARDRPLDDARRLGYDRRSHAPRGCFGNEGCDAHAGRAQQRADVREGAARTVALALDDLHTPLCVGGAAGLFGRSDDPRAGAE